MDNGGVTISLGMDELRKPGVATLLASLVEALHGEPRGRAASTNGGARPAQRRRRQFKPPGGGEGWTWETFEGTLTENHRKFLGIVRDKGTAGLADVAEALGLPGKAIGGLVGSLARKAENREVSLPFTATTDPNGDRRWTWTTTA